MQVECCLLYTSLDIEIRQSGDTHSPVIQPLKDESLEKMKIINALKACNGHREQAAALLNINPATLYRKMKKMCIRDSTYATEITLSHGVPLETVSRMLGHSQIETTQIYAKVTDEKIDADTKALNRKISERFSVVI